jgi:hypothetical protein
MMEARNRARLRLGLWWCLLLRRTKIVTFFDAGAESDVIKTPLGQERLSEFLDTDGR